jgi:hypothetical protein
MDVPKDESQDLDRPLWGVTAIAREINRTERATYHLLKCGRLSAKKVGHVFVSSPRALRLDLAIEPKDGT